MVRAIVTMVMLIAMLCAARAEKRVALVIGNSAYQHTSRLANPRNDANDIAAALRLDGFEVVTGVDLDKRAMEGAIREFTTRIAGTTALFFYAGHSLQVGKQNFLMPVDARLLREADVDFETVPLTLVLRHMQAQAKRNLVFLDACRDNPLARTLARAVVTRSSFFGRGLAAVEASGIDTLVGFSTQPENVAMDGSGRNSPYAAALLRHMNSGLEIGQVMMNVRRDVFEVTQQQQVPWEHSSLTGPFYFKENTTSDPIRPTPQKPTTRPSANVAANIPPVAAQLDTAARIKSWVEREYIDDRVTYASTVDWYDKGVISRDAVLQDRAKYLTNWPDRKFTLVPGTLHVVDAGPNRHTVTFGVTYWVRNGRGEERSGRSYLTVDLVSSGGQLVLVRQKEVVQRQP